MYVCQNSGQKGTKAVYFSPSFAGLKVGLAYQPDQNMTDGPATGTAATDGVLRNLLTGVFTYEHAFGTVSLLAGGGFEYGLEPAEPGPNPAFYRAGLQLGFDRFKVGVSGEWWAN